MNKDVEVEITPTERRDLTLMTFGAKAGWLSAAIHLWGRIPTERSVIQFLVNDRSTKRLFDSQYMKTIRGEMGNRSGSGYRLQWLPDPAPGLGDRVGPGLARPRPRYLGSIGSEVFFDTYDVAVLWDSRLRAIPGPAMSSPLRSLYLWRLVDRHSLYVEVEPWVRSMRRSSRPEIRGRDHRIRRWVDIYADWARYSRQARPGRKGTHVSPTS